MPTKPPHIVLFHSDQHRFDCLGVNGHPLVSTPNLDRLAAGGVNFTHAFTPAPTCSPARACLQTGAWPTTHGCVTIAGTEVYQPADPDLPVMTQLLADAGYCVGHVGKFHGEVVGGPTDHGAEVHIPGHMYKAWRAEQGLLPQPRKHGFFGETDPHITPEQSALAWQADRVLEFMSERAAGKQPFFLRWDPVEPHLPNIVPEPYASLVPMKSIEPWPSFPDPLDNKPEAQRRTRQRWGTDQWEWEQWAPIVQRYLGEIALLDHQVGRLLDRLDVLGITQDTLVIYSTDHGDMCGGHGMMDKHFMMYDDVLRVPMIARWPGELEANVSCEAFAQNELDIAKTILAAAGVDAPPSFVGYDLRDLVADPKIRSDAFSQYQGTHQGLYSLRMLRDRRLKYVYNPVSIDELYDLDRDPGELTNLIDDKGYASQLDDMRQRMSEQMTEIGDPLSVPTFDWGRTKLPEDHPASPTAMP